MTTKLASELWKEVKKIGRRGKGRSELLKHLEGKPLTREQAVRAKCYDCMGYFAEGAQDCDKPECPLYPFRPYRSPQRACSRILEGISDDDNVENLESKQDRTRRYKRTALTLGKVATQSHAVESLHCREQKEKEL